MCLFTVGGSFCGEHNTQALGRSNGVPKRGVIRMTNKQKANFRGAEDERITNNTEQVHYYEKGKQTALRLASRMRHYVNARISA